MERLAILASHVLTTSSGIALSHVSTASDNAESAAQLEDKSAQMALHLRALRLYQEGIRKLQTKGELPSMTMYELGLLGRGTWLGPISSGKLIAMLKMAESNGSLIPLQLLPGPWQVAETLKAKLELLLTHSAASNQGMHTALYADYQKRFGGRGLSSNIVVPCISIHSDTVDPTAPEVDSGPPDNYSVSCRVIIADPADSERISRMHLRKEPNFGLFMDSIISTTDNDHWKEQRHHLISAFLPVSSLAAILPVSLARAKNCADRLADLISFDGIVDMSDFLLHEAQAQLQLALLGAPESLMDATNSEIRKTFMGSPSATPGSLSNAMKALYKMAKEDTSVALPSDGCPVRGPLSRALQSGNFKPSTDYGNMLIILFAGHDTTGHTMTWLLFELARNPDIMREAQKEVDAFFLELEGQDPTYQDLSRLIFLDRCITEALRLWPAVANGTFRQLQFDDTVTGPDGNQVMLPRGTFVNIVNWSRHRNPELWGKDADAFDPYRAFEPQELVHVGCPMAARNPQSSRFSPFSHNPRSCLGRNFAQMEMRLILSYLLHHFNFTLAPPYDMLEGVTIPTDGVNPRDFRGVNIGGTMGPMSLEPKKRGERYAIAMKLRVSPRLK